MQRAFEATYWMAKELSEETDQDRIGRVNH